MTNPHDRREDDFDLAVRLLRAAGSREAPPPELEARARAAVEAHWHDRVAARPAQRRGWAMVVLPIAASLAIAAAVVLWWARMDGGPSGSVPAVPPPVAAVALVRGDAISIAGDDPATRRALAAGASLAAGSRIETRAGAVVALALDDETSVRIAPESSVVLAAPGRLELNRGEIYVDHRGERSAEGTGASLEIHTELGVVTEVGTQFAVAVAGGTLRARVREGAVVYTTGSERYLAAAGSELEWAASERRRAAPDRAVCGCLELGRRSGACARPPGLHPRSSSGLGDARDRTRSRLRRSRRACPPRRRAHRGRAARRASGCARDRAAFVRLGRSSRRRNALPRGRRCWLSDLAQRQAAAEVARFFPPSPARYGSCSCRCPRVHRRSIGCPCATRSTRSASAVCPSSTRRPWCRPTFWSRIETRERERRLVDRTFARTFVRRPSHFSLPMASRSRRARSASTWSCSTPPALRTARTPRSTARAPAPAGAEAVHRLDEATEEIVVTTPYSILGEVAGASVNLDRRQILELPHFGDDLNRAVRAMPATSGNEASARFNVRGGRYDEVLVSLDGLELFAPFHLEDLTGIFSILDPEVIDRVDLFAGAFPTLWGDRMTAVLDMRTRTPTANQLNAGISFSNAWLGGARRFAGDRGSWLASARRGYLDLVLDFVDEGGGDDDGGGVPDPRYWDVFSKLDFDLAAGSTFSLRGTGRRRQRRLSRQRRSHRSVLDRQSLAQPTPRPHAAAGGDPEGDGRHGGLDRRRRA